MKGKTWFVVAVLSGVLFSGCFGGEPAAIKAAEGSSSPSVSASASVPPAASTPLPVAIIQVSVGGNATDPVNGSYSLDAGVNVTFDGSGSTGANLSFTWDFGDGGLGAEAVVTYAFSAPGTYNVSLVVEDGEARSNATTITAVVKAAAQVEAAPPLPSDRVLFTQVTGTFSQSYGAAGAPAQPKKFEVPAGAQQITAWLVWSEGSSVPATADLHMNLKNPAGAQVATSASTDFEYIRFNDTTKLVEGSWTIDVVPNTATSASYTLRVFVWLVKPTLTTFTGTFAQQFAQTSTSGFTSKKVMLPAGSQTIVGRLTWSHTPGVVSFGSCGQSARATSDVDLYIFKGTTSQASSARFLACEFAYVDKDDTSPLGETDTEFDMRVVPYIAADTVTWTLAVEHV